MKKLPKRKLKTVKHFNMKRPSIYRMLSNQQKMNIVTLIEQYGMTYAKIGQSYRMNSSSVRDIYLSYKANGDQLICKKSNSGRKPTEAVIKATELVKQQKYLQSWQSLTLKERCEQIYRISGIRIHFTTVKLIYSKLGIKLRKPQQVYVLSRSKQNELKAKRRLYAHKLQDLINKGANIIYMDETTVNSHQRLTKAWSYADKPVKTLIGRKRYGGVTIYGAIGNCLKKPVFMLGESTNIEEFEEFMQQVKLSCKESNDKPYLVIDNHSAHRSNRVKEYLEANFTLLFMPPYSCQFNSIESFWGLAKPIFRRRFAQAVENITSDEAMRNQVLQILKQIPHQTVNSFIVANRKHLQTVLSELE